MRTARPFRLLHLLAAAGLLLVATPGLASSIVVWLPSGESARVSVVSWDDVEAIAAGSIQAPVGGFVISTIPGRAQQLFELLPASPGTTRIQVVSRGAVQPAIPEPAGFAAFAMGLLVLRAAVRKRAV